MFCGEGEADGGGNRVSSGEGAGDRRIPDEIVEDEDDGGVVGAGVFDFGEEIF